jgi:DNA-binding MarR family transcriptional regulator
MSDQTVKIEILSSNECKIKSASSAQQIVFRHGGSQICRVPVSLSRRFYQICLAASAEVAGRDGLTATQFGVLTCLYDEPGLDQNALTARLGIDRSHTSELLFELEANGLLERKISTADRRAKLVCLTRNGMEVCDRLRVKAEAAQAGLLAPLTAADRERFLDMLLNIIEANEAGTQRRDDRRKPRASNGKVAKSRSRTAT